MRYRPKRENYYNGVYGEIHYQNNLEKYCTYLENKNKQLTLTEVMQSLPKRLSNEAYKKAKEMNYEDFVAWWDEQV